MVLLPRRMKTARTWLLLALAACGPIPGDAPVPAPAASTTSAAPGWDLLMRARDLDGRVVGVAPGRATIAVVLASWCEHCHGELVELARLRDRGDVRILGVSFRWQEEYDRRGDAGALRAYLAREAPWLPVVPGGDDLWRALGEPPKVPTLFVYDAAGQLRAVYDRRERAMPDAGELAALLDQL